MTEDLEFGGLLADLLKDRPIVLHLTAESALVVTRRGMERLLNMKTACEAESDLIRRGVIFPFTLNEGREDERQILVITAHPDQIARILTGDAFCLLTATGSWLYGPLNWGHA